MARSKCYQCFRESCGCNWKEEPIVQKMSEKIYKRYIKDYKFSAEFAFDAIVPASERAKTIVQNWLYEVEIHWCNKNKEAVRELVGKKLRELLALRFISLFLLSLGFASIIYGIITKNNNLVLTGLFWVGGLALLVGGLVTGSLSKSIYRYDPRVYNIYYFNDQHYKESYQDRNFLNGNLSFFNKERFNANLKTLELTEEEFDVAMGLYLDGFKGEVKDIILIAKTL